MIMVNVDARCSDAIGMARTDRVSSRTPSITIEIIVQLTSTFQRHTDMYSSTQYIHRKSPKKQPSIRRETKV